MLLVTFKKETKTEEVEKLASEFDLEIFRNDQKNQPLRLEVNSSDKRYWFRSKRREEITEDQFAALTKALNKKVELVAPVYRVPEAEDEVGRVFSVVPDVIIIDQKLENPKIFKTQ